MSNEGRSYTIVFHQELYILYAGFNEIFRSDDIDDCVRFGHKYNDMVKFGDV